MSDVAAVLIHRTAELRRQEATRWAAEAPEWDRLAGVTKPEP